VSSARVKVEPSQVSLPARVESDPVEQAEPAPAGARQAGSLDGGPRRTDGKRSAASR
jgi:hypothetical protein